MIVTEAVMILLVLPVVPHFIAVNHLHMGMCVTVKDKMNQFFATCSGPNSFPKHNAFYVKASAPLTMSQSIHKVQNLTAHNILKVV